MRRRLGPLVILVLVLPALPATAGTYRWIDRNGQVVYSDRPPQPDEVAPEPERAPAPAAPPSAARRPIHPAARELVELSGLKDQMKGAGAWTLSRPGRSMPT